MLSKNDSATLSRAKRSWSPSATCRHSEVTLSWMHLLKRTERSHAGTICTHELSSVPFAEFFWKETKLPGHRPSAFPEPFPAFELRIRGKDISRPVVSVIPLENQNGAVPISNHVPERTSYGPSARDVTQRGIVTVLLLLVA